MNFQPEILLCDDALLVIDKPAGLLSIPDGYDPSKPHLRAILEPEFGRLWIVHRLDKDTSGVLVLARTAAAHRNLNFQFAGNHVHKSYQAIVVGIPPWGETSLRAPIRANVGRHKRSIVDPERGKDAITVFQIKRRFKAHSLVEARPKTGRTHQIRVHLYDLGYPVLADPLYGKTKTTTHIQRTALHAQSLRFSHPVSTTPIECSTPPPPDFEAAIRSVQA